MDRRNTAVLKLNELIAERMDMRIEKKPDLLHLLEPSEEDLYMMIPRETTGTVVKAQDRQLRSASTPRDGGHHWAVSSF